jgi:hypothetical protein
MVKCPVCGVKITEPFYKEDNLYAIEKGQRVTTEDASSFCPNGHPVRLSALDEYEQSQVEVVWLDSGNESSAEE